MKTSWSISGSKDSNIFFFVSLIKIYTSVLCWNWRKSLLKAPYIVRYFVWKKKTFKITKKERNALVIIFQRNRNVSNVQICYFVNCPKLSSFISIHPKYTMGNGDFFFISCMLCCAVLCWLSSFQSETYINRKAKPVFESSCV